MKKNIAIKIITCPQWNARRPAGPLTVVDEAVEIIFHHTDGHHAEIANPQDESHAEAVRYAQDIQAFHMGPQRHWLDSGHNFLVCRNGDILQGRWLTVSSIEIGLMVDSAHCPGKNHQIGIEHEHKVGEEMTKAQKNSAARLQAWIAAQYGRSHVLPVFPHKRYFPTDCPDNLVAEIEKIRNKATLILAAA